MMHKLQEGRMKTECDCDKCVECCLRNPGWFGSIKEVKGAAKIKGLSVKEFAKKYLIREWLYSDKYIHIPAPRRDVDNCHDKTKYCLEEMKINEAGFIRASENSNYIRGYACVFLTKDNHCAIHKSKPFECRETFACDEKRDKTRSYRLEVMEYWGKHQDFVEKLT